MNFKTPRNKTYRLCYITYFLLFFLQPLHADFINGGFESPYIPSNTNTFNPIVGWILTGYTFNGATANPPLSVADLNLSLVSTGGTITGTPGGISDIIQGSTQTLFDYFIEGALPTPTQLLPVTGSQSAMINLRSIHSPLAKSGTGPITGWVAIGRQATSLSQQLTITSSEVDPLDQKVHIRFKAAPVLENPSHAPTQQPFVAIQLNNLTTGRTGANPLFFKWNYAGQAGVPWQNLTTAGTNAGSNTSYLYTDWQAFDISPGNAFIHLGDIIELVVIASGCQPTGHDGHLYLDDVQTSIPSGLWVAATGPQSATPGDNITYTYNYINAGSSSVNNVQIVANLPQSTQFSFNTTFVSVTNPTTGSCSGAGPVICSIGTLQPGQMGTFQLTVNIPNEWLTSYGPVNNGNYPISGDGQNPLLGPLVQTNLVLPSDLSNLIASTNGLPLTATLGVPYLGTFTCSNIPIASATADAFSASCDISNLPLGLSVSKCTINPSNMSWTQPATIPTNQTVTCTVQGTPTTSGASTVTVFTDAPNNSNSTQNTAQATIVVSGGSSVQPVIPATLNGVPIHDGAVVCCGRPVLLGPLSVPGNGPTTYSVTSHAGNVSCILGQSVRQNYLKMNGSGSCTIVGVKNGVTSASLTLNAR